MAILWFLSINVIPNKDARLLYASVCIHVCDKQ